MSEVPGSIRARSCSDAEIAAEVASLIQPAFNSPPVTLYSPALRVNAGKSGVGGVECQVSWMQISAEIALDNEVPLPRFVPIPDTTMTFQETV